MARKKYATEEERRAAIRTLKQAARAREKAQRDAAKAHLRMPNGGYLRKYGSVEEQQAGKALLQQAARKRTKARQKAARHAAASATRIAAQPFIRDVPAIVGSRLRTRLFIAMCERGPITLRDTWYAVSRTPPQTRAAALDTFVSQGLVVRSSTGPLMRGVYYLNPGHPAHGALVAFGLRLAERWPSPPRRTRPVVQAPATLPNPLPCGLFGSEEPSRAMLLIAVTGGVYLSQVTRETSLYSTVWQGKGLRPLEALGVIRRDPRPAGKGGGKGRPIKYRLDPTFFAYTELQALLFALAATVYDDIAGTAHAVGRTDPEIAAHVLEFEHATSHLRDW